MIKEAHLDTATDWTIGFKAGCNDIDHSLPVRRFTGCSAAYIEGYAKGYTSKAKQAVEQLLSSTRDIFFGGDWHGDMLSEDDIADINLEAKSLQEHMQKLEKEVYATI